MVKSIKKKADALQKKSLFSKVFKLIKIEFETRKLLFAKTSEGLGPKLAAFSGQVMVFCLSLFPFLCIMYLFPPPKKVQAEEEVEVVDVEVGRSLCDTVKKRVLIFIPPLPKGVSGFFLCGTYLPFFVGYYYTLLFPQISLAVKGLGKVGSLILSHFSKVALVNKVFAATTICIRAAAIVGGWQAILMALPNSKTNRIGKLCLPKHSWVVS